MNNDKSVRYRPYYFMPFVPYDSVNVYSRAEPSNGQDRQTMQAINSPTYNNETGSVTFNGSNQYINSQLSDSAQSFKSADSDNLTMICAYKVLGALSGARSCLGVNLTVSADCNRNSLGLSGAQGDGYTRETRRVAHTVTSDQELIQALNENRMAENDTYSTGTTTSCASTQGYNNDVYYLAAQNNRSFFSSPGNHMNCEIFAVMFYQTTEGNGISGVNGQYRVHIYPKLKKFLEQMGKTTALP